MKNKDVKEQIQRAAKKLFAKKGFEGTTVRQLCNEAGVSLALVSYHFGGKDQVFTAIFKPLQQFFEEMSYDTKNASEALQSFIHDFVIYRYKEHELISILQQELVMQSPRLDRLSPYILPSWEQLRIILEACEEQGFIQVQSMDYAVNFVMGTMMFTRTNPFLTQLNPTQKDYTPSQVAELTVQFIFRGLHHH